jgi:threonine/homoserine/homoserine lactone efflux protein
VHGGDPIALAPCIASYCHASGVGCGPSCGIIQAMPSLSTLLMFSGVTALLVASPGPGVLYIVGRSIDQGRRAGLLSMFAIESAEVVYVLAAAAGLTALLATSATALDTLRYGGAAYLILLGVRRWRAGDEPLERTAPSGRRVFAQGFVVQLLNPKIAVFFVAYFPQFIDPHAAIAPQVLLLGVVYVAIAVSCDAVWVLASAGLAQRLGRSARARRAIARFSASTFVGLGLLAAFSGERTAA